MYMSISILTLLPVVTTTISPTCTPQPQIPDLENMTYPTTFTEVHSCTFNTSTWGPNYPTTWTNHEQTFTTVHPLPSKPTSIPYTHVATVSGVLTRTAWAYWGGNVTTTSTVTETETRVLETTEVELIQQCPPETTRSFWLTTTTTPTPTTTSIPDLDKMKYPTTLTEVHTCTSNRTVIIPFYGFIAWYDTEKTLTTLQPFPTRPTSFPYTHVVTVTSVATSSYRVGGGLPGAEVITSSGTETRVETRALETGKVAAAETTSV
ncbi:hypothetical protein DM02DRAFT_657919 [Periconia macrospinosa]|uniref:Uncharacterized protein n=1 Tax=Periconia macrospinosa TaxID=97972 RepID=A0A2V1DI55_9PLEO|nr:hypothetical protein DM02DRAFT_657919 [Periconia macrospinosa]